MREGASPLQRWTMPLLTLKSDEELIKDGKGGDIVAINEISNWGKVSDGDKIELLDKLVNQGGGTTWRDSTTVRKIWGAFNDLEATVNAHPERWQKSIKVPGAELGELESVKKLKEQFAEVVKDTAHSYLNSNRELARQQQMKYGLPVLAEEKPEPLDDQQKKDLLSMQAAAVTVSANQKAQEEARKTVVGYRFYEAGKGPVPVPGQPRHGSWGPAKFDPDKPTEKDTDPAGKDSPPATTWTAMNDKWKASVEKTKDLLKEYPALYAVSREGSSDLTTKFATKQTPEEARAFLGRALESLVKDIQAAEKALVPKDGKLNPLDLTPVAQGLINGSRKPENSRFTTDWTKPLGAFAGKEALKDHELDRALSALGYTMAAEALFILAPFTGGASLFVALAGLGVLAAKAGDSAQREEMLAQAAKTSVDPDKDIVSDKEVSLARMEREADEAALALAALTLAAAGAVTAITAVASGARALRLRSLVPNAELLGRLKELARDDAALERLLRKAGSPEAVEDLLKQAGSAAKAEEMLGSGGIDFSKQLSSGGDKGSLAGRAGGYGVYEGRVPGVVEPVAIKVFPVSEEAYFLNEMKSAEAAASTGRGPKFYGKVEAGPGKLAFAMEKISGEFAVPYKATRASALARTRVTFQTVQDCQDFGREILDKGRYSRGDVQGLITKDGRWRPIDFGSYEPLPDQVKQPSAYQEALRKHKNAVDFEAESLRKIAQENAAKAQ